MHQYLYDVVVASVWLGVSIFLQAYWGRDELDPSAPWMLQSIEFDPATARRCARSGADGEL